MLATILFFLIAALAALWGAKAGLTAAGKFLLTMFIAAFFPLWTLEETLKLGAEVPAAAAKFLPSALLLVETLVLAAILTLIWRKLAEKFPALDDSPTLAVMPRLNAVAGAVAGGAAGFLLAGSVFMAAALLPVAEIPVLSREAVVRRAATAALTVARTVDRLGGAPEMTERQSEYLARRFEAAAPKPSAEPEQKAKDGASAPPPRRSSPAVEATLLPAESGRNSGGSSVYGGAINRARRTVRSAERTRSGEDYQ